MAKKEEEEEEAAAAAVTKEKSARAAFWANGGPNVYFPLTQAHRCRIWPICPILALIASYSLGTQHFSGGS